MADGNTTVGDTTVPADPLVGQQVGTESSLSNWVGPYVTEMLGRGQALATQPYQSYAGPLTAGESAAQQAAFSGIAGLTIPTEQMGAFTPQTFGAEQAQQYMNPYLTAALQPQIDEARRQAEIQRNKESESFKLLQIPHCMTSTVTITNIMIVCHDVDTGLTKCTSCKRLLIQHKLQRVSKQKVL